MGQIKRLLKFLTLIFSGYLFSTAAFAECTKINFSWEGNASYSASGVMIYDNTLPIVAGPQFPDVSNGFVGPTRGIEFLEIEFFDDTNNLLNTHTPVSNGESSYFLLRVSFNTSTLEFFSIFDIGSDEEAGDNYLLRFDESVPGATNFNFFLFESSGTTVSDNALDSGGAITITSQEMIDCAADPTPVAIPLTPLWAKVILALLLSVVVFKLTKQKSRNP